METKRHIQSLVGKPGFLCASPGSSPTAGSRAGLPPASFSCLTHRTEWGSARCGLGAGEGVVGVQRTGRLPDGPVFFQGGGPNNLPLGGEPCDIPDLVPHGQVSKGGEKAVVGPGLS